MADVKLTDLTALADNPADDDLFYLVDDSEALDVNKSKKVTFSNMINNLERRLNLCAKTLWVDDGETTWTYASATSFTVSGDVTDIFVPGTKIRYKQTDPANFKYGYVASSSESGGTTTVTLIENDDYALANASISSNYYSYAFPPDFPTVLNFTPAWTATTTNPTIGNGTLVANFRISEKMVFWNTTIIAGSSTTFGSGAWAIEIPIAAPAYNDSALRWLNECYARDSSGDDYYQIIPEIQRYATDIDQYRWVIGGSGTDSLDSTTPFTWAEDDRLVLSGAYPIGG